MGIVVGSLSWQWERGTKWGCSLSLVPLFHTCPYFYILFSIPGYTSTGSPTHPFVTVFGAVLGVSLVFV
jgi:hypothetical protein